MRAALRWTMALGAIALVALPGRLRAQTTVTGVVSSADQPVRGATVAIAELRLTATTNADGRYSFLVPSAMIRGQTVTIVARHSRYGSHSAQIVLAGAPIEQDFVLTRMPRAPSLDSVAMPVARAPMAGRRADSSAFTGLSGPVDLVHALAGRIPGLVVSSGTAGGASRMVYRGPRSLVGSTQPLVVIDGAVVENQSITSALQQFGLGGFDYGTPLQDIPIENIETATLLDGASAVPRFGSRAANGVLVLTTKRSAAVDGLQLSGNVRYSGERAIRLPAYQNSYGQGLGGQFEFFDGSGGGINDGVDQNWGPKLDGQPIAQASYTSPRRPEVRYWLPRSSAIDDYFESGRTIDVHGALGIARPTLSGRAAFDARSLDDLRPDLTARRMALTLNGNALPTPRLTAGASLQFTAATANDRPGTGFSEVNPVAGFTRMGRQVDLDSLRANVTGGSEQINWIYTGKNNPFFQPLRNSNDDSRNQVLGAGWLRYALGRGLTAELDIGVSDAREERNVDVAQGWLGVYPTALGLRDFSDGGVDQQSIELGERQVSLAISSAVRRRFGLDWAGTFGVSKRSNTFSLSSVVTDTATVTAAASGDASVTALYLLGSTSRGNQVSVDWGLRMEDATSFPSTLGFAVFPSLTVSYDLGRQVPSLNRLGSAHLRASWWRAGNEVGTRALRLAYAGAGTSTEPRLGAGSDSVALPERTTGMQLTGEVVSSGGRAGLDISLYREASREVMVTAGGLAASSGAITNSGIEAHVRTRVPMGAGEDRSWTVDMSFARNTNTVDELGVGVTEVALAPTLWGASLVARTGEPYGVILGTRFLRDSASGQLVLRNGLPVADAGGVFDLGTIQPNWTAGLGSRLRVGGLELAVLFDARFGGRVFSATNHWGSFAGSLEHTVTHRETGITLSGIDSVTGTDTTMIVSAEDYHHALGAIHEAAVYDATWWKLRDARVAYTFPMRFVPGFRDQRFRVSLIGRNLVGGSRAPNIDPETVLSTGAFQGFEMGQHPTTRSLGIQLSIGR